MKISAFNPQIVTTEADTVVELFEELGFEKRHKKEDNGVLEDVGIRMKDENGFYIDVSKTEVLSNKDMTAIRMNVDDFDEAYKLLTDKGFRNLYGKHTADTKSSKSAMMISPSGFAINLIHHIK